MNNYSKIYNTIFLTLSSGISIIGIAILSLIIASLLNTPILNILFSGIILALESLSLNCLTTGIFILLIGTVIVIYLESTAQHFFTFEDFKLTFKMRHFIKYGHFIYRRWLCKSYVKITDSKIQAFIKTPFDQNELQSLKNTIPLLFEEITSSHPEYTYSGFAREKGYYILKGSKI